MNGIINIYKEPGYTSHDVVARLRGILHTRKIGHTGTLDPMAEGVLPVCVGDATKLCESFTDHDKEYVAGMILGETYDTLDITGVIQEKREVMSTKDEIVKAVRSFIGGYDQVPPMYSARKVGGRKLYDLARSGVVVERRSVFVQIYDIDILDISIPHVMIRVKCGKGTYIRSLIDDIGKVLGCGAAMETLTRTKVGEFTAEDAYRIDDIEKAANEDRISEVILGVEEIFGDLERFDADPGTSKLLHNGNVIPGSKVRRSAGDITADTDDGMRIRMYDSTGRFIGVYEYKKPGDIYKPYKMFLNSGEER